MKQITRDTVTNLLAEHKMEFQSTHNKLCLPVINRIYRKMMLGIKFSAIKVADGLITDGHHRYLASRLAGLDLEKNPSVTTSATTVTDWDSVIFVDEDWDTEYKIKMLNEQDARYNNIPMEELIRLLK